MIRRLVDFALQNRFLVLAIAVLLFAWGAVSFHQLPVEAYPDVANNYVDVIAQWPGISAEQIVFEITERDAIRNLRLMETFLQNLKDDGFRFAVDDFGAGYASLSYLRLFPIDFLKIDGPFVLGAGEGNVMDRAIVKSIVTLGKEMGIRIIGEYIENQKILDVAREERIEFGQGYHLGRPSPDLPTPDVTVP